MTLPRFIDRWFKARGAPAHRECRRGFPPVSDRGLNARGRGGFTLVELLVVIIIIITVTAAAIPVVLPLLDSRRVREASRLVSTQFAQAQTTALANGRAAGVWIERLPNDTSGAMDIYLAEVPPPYAGDTVNSRATVQQTSTTQGTVQFKAADASWHGLVKPGDLIRFGYGGPLYVLQTAGTPDADGTYGASSATSAIEFRSATTGGQVVLPPGASNPPGIDLPFQIFRQPVKSGSTPLQMPEGTVIDMAFCGQGNGYWGDTGTYPNFLTDTRPVVITFNRTGGLDSVTAMGNPPVRITQPIHILIGKSEKTVNNETDTTKQNLVDLDNIWISINPQSGLVTTSENVLNGGTSAADVITARQIARSAQTMGGK